MTWAKVRGRLKRALKKRLFTGPGGYDVATRVQNAKRLAQGGRFVEAEEILTEALARCPDDPAPLEALARAAWLQKDWRKTLKRARLLTKRHPDNVEGWVMTAKALVELRHLATAERVLEVACAKWPDHPGPLAAKARVAQRRKNWPEALARWRAVVERDPGFVEGRVQAARALIELRRPKEAEASLLEILADRPGHVGAKVTLAKVLLLLGRPAEAEQSLTGNDIQSPDDPAIMEALALVSESRQRWAEALKRWQALAACHRDYYPPRIQLHNALCLLKLGRTGDARLAVAGLVGAREEGPAFKDLFGACAPLVGYYGGQIEQTFRNLK